MRQKSYLGRAAVGLVAAFCAGAQAFVFLPSLNTNVPAPSRAIAPKGVAPVLRYWRNLAKLR